MAAELVVQLLGVGPVVGHLRAADDHLDRRRRAEAHDLVDDVGRLERQPQVLDLPFDLVRPARPRRSTSASAHSRRWAGSFSRRRCFSSSTRTAPRFRATRITASSGPPIHR